MGRWEAFILDPFRPISLQCIKSKSNWPSGKQWIHRWKFCSLHPHLTTRWCPSSFVSWYVCIYIYRELLWYNYGYVYHAFDPSATLQYTNLKLTRGHRLTQEIINSVNSDGIKWLSPKSNSFKVPRGAVVSACGNSGQWQHALALLSEMQQDGIQGQRRLASPGWRSHWTTWMWSETAPPNTK